ncbi:hypothetical protein, partial [Vreelandella aquamarina]|uniref:hypothetical protein n=1 Tax=Vreelandella aquamarina TaxID=77097 RepID=UPI001CC8254F
KIKSIDVSLALIFGDLSPSSANAHMNYLIKLLKSCFAEDLSISGSMTGAACLSEEGVFYAFPGGCQGRCFRCKTCHIQNR